MGHHVAALLCAGYATRMGALTAETPKPLLPVAGRPVVDYLLDQLAGLPELDAVHVVTNSRHAAAFETWAAGWRERLPGRGRPRGLGLEIHDDGTRDNAGRLGAIGDLAFLLRRVGTVDGALVAAGDNVLRFPIAPLWRSYLAGPGCRVLALHEPDPARLRETGVLELAADQRVIELHEKPRHPPSPWACPPIYCLGAAALARLTAYLDGGRPRDEIGRFLAYLVAREPVYALPTHGRRLHVGSPETWRRADEILRREPVFVPSGEGL